MNTFHELTPRAELAPYLASVWVKASGDPQRAIADGCVTITCRPDGSVRVHGPRTESRPGRVAQACDVVVGARLRPAAAGVVLGIPPAELIDVETDADVLGGDWSRRLGEQFTKLDLSVAPDALQAAILGRVRRLPDPLVVAAVARLSSGRPLPLATLASELAISERQLRRRVQNTAGLGPKPLQRLLRFQGFLALVQRDLAHGCVPEPAAPARFAADAGYADQAHLTREVVRITGLPPRAFISETAHTCGLEHDHRASYEPVLHLLGTNRDSSGAAD